MELQKYVDEFIFLVRIMQEQSDLPCFKGFDIDVFRDRFKEKFDEKSVSSKRCSLPSLTHSSRRCLTILIG